MRIVLARAVLTALDTSDGIYEVILPPLASIGTALEGRIAAGVADCLDHSARPHQLPWKATKEERAIVCTLRRVTNFALDDLTFVISHFLPHLNRDSIWRILKAEGLNRRCKRFLYVAIDRRSRSVHLAVKDNETEASAIAFLHEAASAFPFRMTHVLTDNGSCFTPAFARVCTELGAQYRHTKPRSPQTNGMVERFNGRIGSKVLAITIYSHHQLEQLLRGFNAAYNARRQRVLETKTPDQIVAERLTAKPARAKNKLPGRAGPCDITKARMIAENAKEVSQPDMIGRLC
jgi:hypothetical protein